MSTEYFTGTGLPSAQPPLRNHGVLANLILTNRELIRVLRERLAQAESELAAHIAEAEALADHRAHAARLFTAAGEE